MQMLMLMLMLMIMRRSRIYQIKKDKKEEWVISAVEHHSIQLEEFATGTVRKFGSPHYWGTGSVLIKVVMMMIIIITTTMIIIIIITIITPSSQISSLWQVMLH